MIIKLGQTVKKALVIGAFMLTLGMVTASINVVAGSEWLNVISGILLLTGLISIGALMGRVDWDEPEGSTRKG